MGWAGYTIVYVVSVGCSFSSLFYCIGLGSGLDWPWGWVGITNAFGLSLHTRGFLHLFVLLHSIVAWLLDTYAFWVAWVLGGGVGSVGREEGGILGRGLFIRW